MAKNIGGAAKTVTLSLHDLAERLDRAYSMGIEAGRDVEQKLERLATENDCPMCSMKAELQDVKRRLAVREHSDQRRRHA